MHFLPQKISVRASLSFSWSMVGQQVYFGGSCPQVSTSRGNGLQLINTGMQKTKIKQEWCQEEKKLLTELFPCYSSKKWKMISQKMAEFGFTRTELECREKWINFLDPTINNDDWNSEELEKLYRLHDQYGTRWCFMQKQLNRTQNRIKNRFYGTIRNYIRAVLNTLCERHSSYNAEISKISPSLLNDLYNSENVFDFLRGQIKKMIFRMNFQIDKKMLKSRIRDKEKFYRELLSIIGGLFKTNLPLKYLERIEKPVPTEKMENEGKSIAKQSAQKVKISSEAPVDRSHIFLQVEAPKVPSKCARIVEHDRNTRRKVKIITNIEEKRPELSSKKSLQKQAIKQQVVNGKLYLKIEDEPQEVNQIISETPVKEIPIEHLQNSEPSLEKAKQTPNMTFYPFMQGANMPNFFNNYDMMMEKMKFYNMMLSHQQGLFRTDIDIARRML